MKKVLPQVGLFSYVDKHQVRRHFCQYELPPHTTFATVKPSLTGDRDSHETYQIRFRIVRAHRDLPHISSRHA
jgi:hypothetical protein